MPEPFVISPAGYIQLYNYAAVPFRGSSQAPFTVVPVQAGSVALAQGAGDYPVTAVRGDAGTMDVHVTLGPTGSARGLAFLVDNALSPTAYLGIALDAQNRPYGIVKDTYGAAQATGMGAGPVLPSGLSLTMRFSWDATRTLEEHLHVWLKGNGLYSVWSGGLTTWVPFKPTALLVGSNEVGGLSAFNGSNLVVQITNSSTVSTDNVETEITPFTANSTFAATAKVAWKVQASLAASSSVTASLTVA